MIILFITMAIIVFISLLGGVAIVKAIESFNDMNNRGGLI